MKCFILVHLSNNLYINHSYLFNFIHANKFSCFKGCLESRGRSHRGYYSRMKRYLYDFWNVVDLLSYALLITALFVRHLYPSETFTIARRMFSLSLLVMYLRFLEVFLIHRKLGPTLIMIKEMVKYFLNNHVIYYHCHNRNGTTDISIHWFIYFKHELFKQIPRKF